MKSVIFLDRFISITTQTRPIILAMALPKTPLQTDESKESANNLKPNHELLYSKYEMMAANHETDNSHHETIINGPIKQFCQSRQKKQLIQYSLYRIV